MDRLKNLKEFDEILLSSIDEAFSSLGENVKTKIFLHLEQDFLIAKQDIPHRIHDFSDALERIFGIGARHLELLIMKKLHETVDCSYKYHGPKWLVPDLTFEKYVNLLRICYEDESETGHVEVVVDAGQRQEQQA